MLDEAVTWSDGYHTQVALWLPSPRTGAPLLVSVHGVASDRLALRELHQHWTKLGFAVAAYDVRGQGAGLTSNPSRGSRWYSSDEWLDLAEVIHWVGSRAPDLDLTRVGVVGTSQGGLHALAAAAFSQATIPGNGRAKAPFPRIRAVVAEAMHADWSEILYRDGCMPLFAVERAFGASPGMRLEPELRQQVANAILTGDSQWLNTLAREPARMLAPRLRQSTTAVLAMASWNDPIAAAAQVCETLQLLPASTSKHLVLTTGHHGTWMNHAAGERMRQLADRWLLHHVAGRAQALPESEASVDVMPAQFAKSTQNWQRWPADLSKITGASRQREHQIMLRWRGPESQVDADANLRWQWPGAPRDRETLTQRGGNPEAWASESVLGTWCSEPLEADFELLGAIASDDLPRPAHAQTWATSHVAVVVGDSAQRFATAWCSPSKQPQSSARFEPIAMRIPAGARLQLELSALPMRAVAGQLVLTGLPAAQPTVITAPATISLRLPIRE